MATRVAMIADMHGELPEIPACDLIVLAGDLCWGPEHRDGRWRPDLSDEQQYRWLCGPFAQWIIEGTTKSGCIALVVAGNHDTCIERYGFPSIPGCRYLFNSSIYEGHHTEGMIKAWGSPCVNQWDNLAFNRREEEMSFVFAHMPPCDVAVCHSPPYGVLDNGQYLGSRAVLVAIQRVQPRLMVCGHIHEGHGIAKVGNTLVVNASRRFVVVEI